jgi:hypothetical protein
MPLDTSWWQAYFNFTLGNPPKPLEQINDSKLVWTCRKRKAQPISKQRGIKARPATGLVKERAFASSNLIHVYEQALQGLSRTAPSPQESLLQQRREGTKQMKGVSSGSGCKLKARNYCMASCETAMTHAMYKSDQYSLGCAGPALEKKQRAMQRACKSQGIKKWQVTVG